MSNYPPGVTGNEFAIAGPDYEVEVDAYPCPDCGGGLMEQGYDSARWVTCTACDYQADLEPDEYYELSSYESEKDGGTYHLEH